jgi:thymidylate synthase (FAD)
MITATLIDHMGSDLSVVNAARVSYDKRSDWEYHDSQTMRLSGRDTRLIKFLAKHKHTSPFNHAFASFHVKAPIFVARQLVKHEYLPWNEVSGRYVVFKGDFYTPTQFRMSAEDKKQGSGGDAEPDLNAEFTTVFTDGQMAALKSYEYCIKAGMAEEQARARLPLDLMTQWYWSGSLGAFAKMCNLRCKEDTQYESRVVADQISEMMSELYPVSWAALMKGEKQ